MSPVGTIVHAQGQAPRAAAGRAARAPAQAGPAAVRRRHEDRRRRRRRAAVGRQRRSATCWCAGRGSLRDYFKDEGGNPLTTPTAGSRPATSRPSTPTATCRSPTARKDVIKSGGEWISSIELENIAVGASGRRRGRGDRRARIPKWDERPLLVVVQEAERRASTREELLALLRGQGRQVVDAGRRRVRRRAPAYGATGKLSEDARCASSSRTTGCPRPDGDRARTARTGPGAAGAQREGFTGARRLVRSRRLQYSAPPGRHPQRPHRTRRQARATRR